MKEPLKYIIITLIVLLIGIISGWYWHKSTVKPVIIQKPGQTITITQWKTNTVTVQKPIQHYIQVIKWQDKPVYVYSLIDTIITNKYQYQNFLQSQGSAIQDIISFNVQTRDQIKTYADTTFNNSYLQYKQNLRITDFVYKPAPIEIKPKQIKSKLQLYGNISVQKQSNNLTPFAGISALIGQKYQVNAGINLDKNYYLGIGLKFIDWK